MIDSIFKIIERTCPDIRQHLLPPESIADTPALLLIGEDGVSRWDAYSGGRVRETTYSVMLLATERRQINEAVQVLRREHPRILAVMEADYNYSCGRIVGVQWSEGTTEYAGVPYASISYQIQTEQYHTVAELRCEVEPC